MLQQPLLQPFRLNINKLYLGRPVKYMIRNTLQNGGFQNGKHRILNAFDMLNIQRGINVYARFQQLLDVLIAFPVAGIVRISVGELIN